MKNHCFESCKNVYQNNDGGYIFNKIASWIYATKLKRTLPNFVKKRLQHRCFPMNIAKSFKNNFFEKHLQWSLLLLVIYLHLIEKIVLQLKFEN